MKNFKALLFLSLIYTGFANASAWWPFGGSAWSPFKQGEEITPNSRNNFDDAAIVPDSTNMKKPTNTNSVYSSLYDYLFTKYDDEKPSDTKDIDDNSINMDMDINDNQNINTTKSTSNDTDQTTRSFNNSMSTLNALSDDTQLFDQHMFRYAFAARQALMDGKIEDSRLLLQAGLNFIKSAQNDGISMYDQFIPKFENALYELE